MRDLSATGRSGIRQNLGTDVRLGKKTFFGMATTKEVGVRDQDSPFQTLTPGGGRGTPLDKPYRYVPPQRVGFLSRFGRKTGIDFVHFGLESGTISEGTS